MATASVRHQGSRKVCLGLFETCLLTLGLTFQMTSSRLPMSLVVIDAHDDETFWLTVILPNDTRIVCVLPRPEIIAAIEQTIDAPN